MPLIALIGMPGVGKTTVGRHLARSLGQPFVDVDSEVEKRIGCSIRAFFEREGEARFRDIEQETLGQVLGNCDIVIATGGGSVLREANRSAMRAAATVVYLRTTPEELYRRLRHDTQRPLLQGGDPLRRLRDLFRDRDGLYRQTAHFVIDIGRPSVSGLLNMILMQLELAGLVDPSRGLPRTTAPTDSAA